MKNKDKTKERLLKEIDLLKAKIFELEKSETEQKQAEESLQESKGWFKELAELIPQPIWETDLEGNLTFSNRIGFELFGYTQKDLEKGVKIIDLIAPEDRQRVLINFSKKLKEKQFKGHEYKGLKKDGTKFPILIYSSPIYSKGKLTGLRGVTLDITELKQAEETLQSIATKFSAVSGLEFFEEVCRHLTDTLQMDWAFVGELLPDEETVKVKSGIGKGKHIEQFEYNLADTPCENIMGQSMCCYPSGVQSLFPKDYLLVEMGIESYIGIPLFNRAGNPLGIMVLLDSKPIDDHEIAISLLQIFSERVAAEIERIQAEDAFRQQAERIHSIVDTSQDWIWSIDLQGIHTYSNPAIERILGYPLDKLLGKPSFNLMHNEDRKMIEREFPRWISEKRGWQGNVIRWKHKDGSWRYLESSAVPIIDMDGKITGFRGVDRDITERKQADQALKSSEERLKILFESAPDAYYLSDLKGTFIDGNKAAEDLMGYKKEELIGKSFMKLKLLSAKEILKASKLLLKNVQGKGTGPDEFILNRKDGSQIPVEISTYPVKIKSKTVVLGIARDISERKKAEEAQHQFEHIVSSSTDMLALLNKRFNYLAANKAYSEAFKLTPEQFIGNTVADVFGEEFFNTVIKPYGDRCLAGEEVNYQDWFDFPAHGKCFMDITYYPYYGEDNKIIGFVVNGRNITKSKLSEDKLKESEKKFSSIVKSSPMGMHLYSLEPDGKLIFIGANPAADILLGVDNSQFIGKTIEEAFPPLSDTEIPKRYREAASTGRSWQTEQVVYEDEKISGAFEVYAFQTLPGKMVALFLEITERKRAEQELRQSEERFKRLFEDLGDAVYVTKIGGASKGQILEANSAAVRQTGYTRKELLKMNIIGDFYISGSGDINTDEWEEKLYKGEIVTTIEKKRRRDGTEFWTEVIVTPIEFKGEKASLSINHDITERKQAEEALRESEKKNNALLNTTLDLAMLIDKNGKIIAINKAMARAFDQTPDKLINKVIYDLLPPDLAKQRKKKGEEAVKLGRVVRFVDRRGDRWLDNSTYPIFDEKGEISQYAIFSQDITERKRAEQIQKVLYNISNAVNTTDNLKKLLSLIQKELGIIIDTTNFYVALYNTETDTIILPFMADKNDKVSSFPAEKTLTHYVIKTQKPLLADKERFEKLIKSGDVELSGTDPEIWLGVPLKVEGKVTGVLAVQSYSDEIAFDESDMKMLEFISDQISISIDRKKNEEDLITALRKAEESDRLKSAFLATMSHELRTPLNAIIGFSDIIDEDMPINDIVDFSETINSSGKHLLSIVEDLFDITLIESGEIKIVKENIKLGSVLNNVHEIIKIEQQKTNKDNLELKLTITQEEKNLTINTDPSKLEQILINLLKNALKFTNEGHVHYGYSLKTDSEPAELKFYIEDTGIGIPDDKQELIFNVFRQADDTHIRRYGGTGIGLSISKKLTELLGGKIWLESKKVKGSTFYFTIPYEGNEIADKTNETETEVEKKTETEKKNKLKKKTVLIVEDVESSYEFLKIVLEKSGINTLWAKDGEDSIKLCKENTYIDLVLMDINMPLMNGYEATKEIRKFRPDLPIIAQTAYAIAGDREKSLAAGCDDYISKPIKQEVLVEKIVRFLGG